MLKKTPPGHSAVALHPQPVRKVLVNPLRIENEFTELSVLVWGCHPSRWEAEEGGSGVGALWIITLTQPGLHQTLSQM